MVRDPVRKLYTITCPVSDTGDTRIDLYVSGKVVRNGRNSCLGIPSYSVLVDPVKTGSPLDMGLSSVDSSPRPSVDDS